MGCGWLSRKLVQGAAAGLAVILEEKELDSWSGFWGCLIEKEEGVLVLFRV